MAKWIEWVEPFIDSEPVFCRVSPETAILAQKKSAANTTKKFVYSNDQDALDDFIICHWAQTIETP
jgi:hypothetical protein